MYKDFIQENYTIINEIIDGMNIEDLQTFEVSNLPELPLDLNKLNEWSVNSLDSDDLRANYIASQMNNLELKKAEAKKIIIAAAAAAAAAQAQAQAQSTYSGVSSYSGGAYGRTEGSTSGSNTYRGTTSGGSGPAASAPKPNLNGAYGCGNSCTGKDDGYYHH